MILELILLSIGIIIGILLSFIVFIFQEKIYNLTQKVGVKLNNQQAYLAGSEDDSERFPEDKEVKIK